MPGGSIAKRHYSIYPKDQGREAYEVAVLLEDSGRGGSRALHASYCLGLRINAANPANAFALHDDAQPAVLIAGGIGITPIRAMAAELAATGRSFEIHYAARSRVEAAFANSLQLDFGDRLHLYISDEGRRLDSARLVEQASIDAVLYVCGPPSLIDAVRGAAQAAGISDERVRVEHFVAAGLGLHERPVTLHLRHSGRRIEVTEQQTLLEALEAAGIEALSSCRVGTCGTCAVKVLAGVPDHRDQALSDDERRRAGLMCVCVSRAISSALTLDL